MARELFVVGIRFFSKSGPAECVFHGAIDDPTGGDELVWSAAINAALEDGVAPAGFLSRLVLLMSEDAFISSSYVSRISGIGGNQVQHLYQGDDYPGAISGPYSASQVAACIIWSSVDAANKTGRNFIPFVPDSELDDGRFSAAYKTAVDNFIEQVISGLSTTFGTFKFGFYKQTPKTVYEFTDGYLSRKVGTQRRREVPL